MDSTDYKLPENDLFKDLGVHNVNHRPHPYTIGVKHVEHAAKHHSGRLGMATVDKIPCAVKGCQLSYAEHTYDTVLMVSLKRNLSQEEARQFLVKIKEDLQSHKIDGVTFVETDEKYRFDGE